MLLEDRFVGLLLSLADRSAVGSREGVTTDIRVIEERLQSGGDVTPQPACEVDRLAQHEYVGNGNGHRVAGVITASEPSWIATSSKVGRRRCDWSSARNGPTRAPS